MVSLIGKICGEIFYFPRKALVSFVRFWNEITYYKRPYNLISFEENSCFSSIISILVCSKRMAYHRLFLGHERAWILFRWCFKKLLKQLFSSMNLFIMYQFYSMEIKRIKVRIKENKNSFVSWKPNFLLLRITDFRM